MSIKEGEGHFYDHENVGADIAKQAMKRLKYDNDTIEYVFDLANKHCIVFVPETRQANRLLNKMGIDKLNRLIALQKADVKAQNPKFTKERLANIQMFEEDVAEKIVLNCCSRRYSFPE